MYWVHLPLVCPRTFSSTYPALSPRWFPAVLKSISFLACGGHSWPLDSGLWFELCYVLWHDLPLGGNTHVKLVSKLVLPSYHFSCSCDESWMLFVFSIQRNPIMLEWCLPKRYVQFLRMWPYLDIRSVQMSSNWSREGGPWPNAPGLLLRRGSLTTETNVHRGNPNAEPQGIASWKTEKLPRAQERLDPSEADRGEEAPPLPPQLPSPWLWGKHGPADS